MATRKAKLTPPAENQKIEDFKVGDQILLFDRWNNRFLDYGKIGSLQEDKVCIYHGTTAVTMLAGLNDRFFRIEHKK